MNITIINGAANDSKSQINTAVITACSKLEEAHTVDLFTPKDMDINYCRGCFSCWVKSPGRCVFKDDMDDVLRSIVKADLLLVVSPLKAGFITSEAKKTLDRVITLVLPFIGIYDGESHHHPRYENNADLGVILMDDGNLQDEAKDIVYESFDRMAKNFHAKKVIKATANEENLLEVLENEISNY